MFLVRLNSLNFTKRIFLYLKARAMRMLKKIIDTYRSTGPPEKKKQSLLLKAYDR